MKEIIKVIAKCIFRRDYREELIRREIKGCIETVASGDGSGKNKIMILQRGNTEVGFFSDYIVFLRMIEEAIERNYIPVVDRKTIKNIFFPAGDEINTWECFFEQPMKYTLDDIDYCNMDISINHIPSSVFPVSIMHCQDEAVVKYWRNIAKRFIRFKPDILKHLQNNYKDILGNKRVLGVSVREGYIKLSEGEPQKIAGHPIQTDITELLAFTEKYLSIWNCDYVYITCQTIETQLLFEKKFREKTIIYNRSRCQYCDLPEGSEIIKNKDNYFSFEHELEYVTEMYLLSKCTAFICSENSGSEAAFIMSEGFEHFICLSRGVYNAY